MTDGIDYGYGIPPAPQTAAPAASPFAGLLNGFLYNMLTGALNQGFGSSPAPVAPHQGHEYGYSAVPAVVPSAAPVATPYSGLFDGVFGALGGNWWILIVLFFFLYPSAGKGLFGPKY